MQGISVIVFTAILSVVVCRPDETYSTKFDQLDIDKILESERLLNSYINCIMTGESCSPEGTELRGNLPDVYKTGCSKCSEKQLIFLKKTMDYLRANKPDVYQKLDNKFDPEGTYKKQHKAKLEAIGIYL